MNRLDITIQSHISTPRQPDKPSPKLKPSLLHKKKTKGAPTKELLLQHGLLKIGDIDKKKEKNRLAQRGFQNKVKKGVGKNQSLEKRRFLQSDRFREKNPPNYSK